MRNKVVPIYCFTSTTYPADHAKELQEKIEGSIVSQSKEDGCSHDVAALTFSGTSETGCHIYMLVLKKL
jgi:hypothetical protein